MLAALLAPTGYMIQDAVADAMTVEAVPRVDENGKPYDEATRKSMHTTMQTLGRVAHHRRPRAGGLGQHLPVPRHRGPAEGAQGRDVRQRLHRRAHHPGAVGAGRGAAPLPQDERRAASAPGQDPGRGRDAARGARRGETQPNWWILGGSLVFVAVTLAVGSATAATRRRSSSPARSRSSLFLLWRLARELDAGGARRRWSRTALVHVRLPRDAAAPAPAPPGG